MVKGNDFVPREGERVFLEAPLIVAGGNRSTTFREHFQQTGKILILATYDYNSLNIVYFSVLTSPDLRIYDTGGTVIRPVLYVQPKLIDLSSYLGSRYYINMDQTNLHINVFDRQCSRGWIGYQLAQEYLSFELPEADNENTLILGTNIPEVNIPTSARFIDDLFFGNRRSGRVRRERTVLETVRLLNFYSRSYTDFWKGENLILFSKPVPTPTEPYSEKDFMREIENYYSLIRKTFLYIGSHEGQYPTSELDLRLVN